MGLKLWQQHIGGDSDVVQEQWRQHTQMWGENSGGNTLRCGAGTLAATQQGRLRRGAWTGEPPITIKRITA